MNKQEIITKIRANRALLEEFPVKSISVFGSAVRDELGRTAMWIFWWNSILMPESAFLPLYTSRIS